MRFTHEVELQPFKTPNFVLAKERIGKRQEGFEEAPKYPLSDLDPYTLEKLCSDFHDEIFRKARKTPPPTSAA